MTDKHPVLFLTDRGQRHQQAALDAAPAELAVTMQRRPSPDQLTALLPGVEFLVSERSGQIDANVIAAGPQLRLIQRLGSFTHDIDLAAAKTAGIPVSALPVHVAIMVAEHMILQILALVKRLPQASAIAAEAGDWGRPSLRTDEETFAYDWSGQSGIGPVYGRTTGILGFGEIGAELARRLRVFQPERILYYRRSQLPAAAEQELGLTYASRDRLAAESDLLCNLLPYAHATDQLVNAAFMSSMKKGALLVSCGSGSVIDEAALAHALRTGHLAGAALDTYEWEPIRPDNPLLPLARDPAANVILTPHVAAGSSRDATADQQRGADYVNVMRVLKGQPLLHRIV